MVMSVRVEFVDRACSSLVPPLGRLPVRICRWAAQWLISPVSCAPRRCCQSTVVQLQRAVDCFACLEKSSIDVQEKLRDGWPKPAGYSLNCEPVESWAIFLLIAKFS